MKPYLHPAHSGETIQPRGPGRICPLSPRGRPTSAAARPPQCGLYWPPGAAASGLGIAVDLKDHDWRHDMGNHGLLNITSTGLFAWSKTKNHDLYKFSLWFADRDYLGEIDSIRQMCFHFSYLFIRTSHKRNNFSNHTHRSCLHQHHHSHSEKTMLIKCGRIEFVLSEQLSTYLKQLSSNQFPSFCFIQITSHKKRQLIIRPFPPFT